QPPAWPMRSPTMTKPVFDRRGWFHALNKGCSTLSRKNGQMRFRISASSAADQRGVQSLKLLVVDQESPCLFCACAIMFILGVCIAKLEFDLSIIFSGLITDLHYQRRSVDAFLPFRAFHPRRRTQARQRIQESLNFCFILLSYFAFVHTFPLLSP